MLSAWRLELLQKIKNQYLMPALYAVKISVDEIIFMFNECNKTRLGEMSFFIRLAVVFVEAHGPADEANWV